MWHLLVLEWKKIKSNLTFRILGLLYLFLLPNLLLFFKRLPELPPEISSKEVLFMFPTVWGYLAYAGNWLVFFFLGFLAVLSVTTELNNRTLRQNIITGLSRREVFLAKLIYLLALSFFATLYYVLTALWIGYFNTDTIYWVKVWQEWDMIPRYFLMCVGYMSFGLLLGLLIRRTGIALFVYISYVLFIELIWRWGIHKNMFNNKSMHFYPMNAIEDLSPLPILQTQNDIMNNNIDFAVLLTPTEAVLTTMFYSAVFLGLAYYVLQRKAL